MRILAKIRLGNFGFCRPCRIFLKKFGAKSDFKVYDFDLGFRDIDFRVYGLRFSGPAFKFSEPDFLFFRSPNIKNRVAIHECHRILSKMFKI